MIEQGTAGMGMGCNTIGKGCRPKERLGSGVRAARVCDDGCGFAKGVREREGKKEAGENRRKRERKRGQDK